MTINLKYSNEIENANERQKQTYYLIFKALNDGTINYNQVFNFIKANNHRVTPMTLLTTSIICNSTSLKDWLCQHYKPFSNIVYNEQVMRLYQLIDQIQQYIRMSGHINHNVINEINYMISRNWTKQALNNYTRAFDLFYKATQEGK